MALVNRKKISLYEEAKDGFISLIQQTAQVFVGLLVMLILTGGNPPGFVVALSFGAGIGFVAWREKKRLKNLRVRKSSELFQEDTTTLNTTQTQQTNSIYPPQNAVPSGVSDHTLVNLSQWLQGVVEAEWHTAEALQELIGRELATVRSNVKRGKLIHLEMQPFGQAVILVVGITPTTAQKMTILLQVYPTGDQTYLPQGLKLILLEASGKPVLDEEGQLMETEAKSTRSYCIQQQLSGSLGEHFNVKIALSNASITTEFII